MECFCGSKFISSKPEGWACDQSCTAKADRAKVRGFLDATCGDSDAKGDTGKPTDQSRDTDSAPQAEVAVNW